MLDHMARVLLIALALSASAMASNAQGTETSQTGQFIEEDLWVIAHPEVSADTLNCLLYTSPSPRDGLLSRMPSSA